MTLTRKHTTEELQELQALPLELKVSLTKNRIHEWVKEYGEDGVYVAFSGGKDSTVLLTIARELYPQIRGVYFDTGLEYPECRAFVKTWDNIDFVKPKKTFKQVIDEYGYPFISKEVSKAVHLAKRYLKFLEASYRTTPLEGDIEITEEKIWNAVQKICNGDIGRNNEGARSLALMTGIINTKNEYDIRLYKYYKKHVPEFNEKISRQRSIYCHEKYLYLLKAPFPITDDCCRWLKKQPSRLYEKQTNRKAMTGMMAEESLLRKQKWLQNGCNNYGAQHPISSPMAFWTMNDVLSYIYNYNIKIPSVYGDVIKTDDGYRTTGCQRIGCVWCGYGAHLDQVGCGRFERLKVTHPKLYDYIMKPREQGGLGYKEAIDWINENGDVKIWY